ncbi:MAG TPA: hypothetical protein VH914_09510 [Acidimicrobiia bacterium]|jgi:hypothetical protein|nr:hypothetical protein [Acidimicrobiia bacterium]
MAGSVRRVACLLLATAFVIGSAASASAAPSSWTLETSPNRGNGPNELREIACATPSSCMALGTFLVDNVYETIGMRWNGRHWQMAPTRNRKDASTNLLSVACSGPDSCLAVGWSQSNFRPDTTALVEHWDGAHWSIVPNPPGTKPYLLFGVACPTTTTCFVVGNRYQSQHDIETPLFERWDDGSLTTVAGSGLQPWVTDLSCPSATTCVAIGATTINNDELRVQTFDGAHWTDAGAPTPSTLAGLQSVSCASPTYCMTSGWYYNWDRGKWLPLEKDGTTKFSLGLVLTWDGTTWAHQNVPRSGHFSNSLAAVSCPSTTQCHAVGSWTHDHVPQTSTLGSS